MSEAQVISQLLEDEGLTSDLDEAEATRLINALLAQAKVIVQQATSDDDGWGRIKALRQRGRQIAKVVATFRDDGAVQAQQRAVQVKLPWPSSPPTTAMQLLEQLLATTVMTSTEGR